MRLQVGQAAASRIDGVLQVQRKRVAGGAGRRFRRYADARRVARAVAVVEQEQVVVGERVELTKLYRFPRQGNAHQVEEVASQRNDQQYAHHLGDEGGEAEQSVGVQV